MARTWKRRWYTYPFVNPRLQIGITLLPFLAGACMTIYFSYLLYMYSIETVMQMVVWFPDKLPQEAVFDRLASMWMKATFFIVGFHLVVLPVLGLFYSHRVAGPLLIVTKKLKELQSGKFPAPIHLRKESYLQDLAADFNATVASLETRSVQQCEKLDAALKALAQNDVQGASEILQGLRSSLPTKDSAS